MGERARALRRLLTFAMTTGFVSVIGVISIPVIISGAGDYQWGIQAAVQSAAALFGVVVAFGWGTTGAATVAAMPTDERPQWYADSLVARFYLLLTVYPAMVLVMGALNPDHLALVAIASAAYLVVFTGGSWYFVGEAKPGRLFAFDALPQSLGVLVSIGVMLSTNSLVATVAVQFVFNTGAAVLSAATILRTSPSPVRINLSPRAALGRLVGQRHAVATSAMAGLYVSAPLLILNVLNPALMPAYAMGDRLFRFGLTAFAPVLQFVQGWIPEGGRDSIPHRIRQAARFTPAISAIGALCILLIGPFAATVLSAGDIMFTVELALPFAIVFLVVSVTQVLGLACLVQLGRTRALMVSTFVGAVLGVPLLIAGAIFAGPVGVAWALACSEVAVLLYQGTTIIRELRSRNS